MTRGQTALLACGCAGLIGGCGSSATHHPPKRTAGGARSGSAASNGESSKPAGRILSDAAAALRGAASYLMQGTITTRGTTLRIRLITTGPNSLDLAFAQGPSAAQLIEVPGTFYMRANASFWRPRAGARSKVLAGRWLQVPSSAVRSAISGLGVFAPATFSRCLVQNHGTLHVAGTTTVSGRPAIIIKDAGNVPGSSPGVLAVAATGPPYPLRFTATGPQRAGGRVDACNNGKASDDRGSFTLGDFGRVPAIQPPPAPANASPAPKS